MVDSRVFLWDTIVRLSQKTSRQEFQRDDILRGKNLRNDLKVN